MTMNQNNRSKKICITWNNRSKINIQVINGERYHVK